MKTALVFCVACLALAPASGAPKADRSSSGWRSILAKKLLVMGHRNWVVVADSAYPEQSAPGIQTIVTNEDHMAVLRAAMAEIGKCKHIRPITYVDEELAYVPEARAPGVGAYRARLNALVGGRGVHRMLHEKIIHMLDEASKTFNVVILKSNETIPYTSVFFNLNCAYWSDADEAAMRKAMAKGR